MIYAIYNVYIYIYTYIYYIYTIPKMNSVGLYLVIVGSCGMTTGWMLWSLLPSLNIAWCLTYIYIYIYSVITFIIINYNNCYIQ